MAVETRRYVHIARGAKLAIAHRVRVVPAFALADKPHLQIFYKAVFPVGSAGIGKADIELEEGRAGAIYIRVFGRNKHNLAYVIALHYEFAVARSVGFHARGIVRAVERNGPSARLPVCELPALRSRVAHRGVCGERPTLMKVHVAVGIVFLHSVISVPHIAETVHGHAVYIVLYHVLAANAERAFGGVEKHKAVRFPLFAERNRRAEVAAVYAL